MPASVAWKLDARCQVERSTPMAFASNCIVSRDEPLKTDRLVGPGRPDLPANVAWEFDARWCPWHGSAWQRGHLWWASEGSEPHWRLGEGLHQVERSTLMAFTSNCIVSRDELRAGDDFGDTARPASQTTCVRTGDTAHQVFRTICVSPRKLIALRTPRIGVPVCQVDMGVAWARMAAWAYGLGPTPHRRVGEALHPGAGTRGTAVDHCDMLSSSMCDGCSAASKFRGTVAGCVFKKGDRGVGYYIDSAAMPVV